MGLLQLQYFKALAERQHLTETAKEFMISAPSLSATIARLESDLGFQLFDREGRNIRLNECGRIYLKYVNDVFAALENAKLEMQDFTLKYKMQLSVAISSPVIWHDAFQGFIREHPHINISHTLLKRDRLDDPSYCSQLDFIVTATSDCPGSEWDMAILIPDDKPLLAVYPSHPLAKREAIRFIEAKEENFIVVSKGFSMRNYFDSMCSMAGFTPKIALECDYMLRSKMFAVERGIVLTTESGAVSDVLSNAVYVKIIDPPIIRRQAIMWNKRRYLSQVAIIFRDFMIDYHSKFSRLI